MLYYTQNLSERAASPLSASQQLPYSPELDSREDTSMLDHTVSLETQNDPMSELFDPPQRTVLNHPLVRSCMQFTHALPLWRT